MTKARIVRLLCKCIDHEDNATTPAGRKYWDGQYKRLRALAVRIGWID
jgi:hypothetical protein